MPIAVRKRIIRQLRFERARRRELIRQTQQWAIRQRAFNTFTLAPVTPPTSGPGHRCYQLGPITFCHRCGATQSFSQGVTLSNPCRGRAPTDTGGHIRSFLKGKPSPFYRRILDHAAVPTIRPRHKTSPLPKYYIPRHLTHIEPPPTPPATLRLTRTTVHVGRCFSRNTNTNADPK